MLGRALQLSLLAVLQAAPGGAAAPSSGASKHVRVALAPEVSSVQPGRPFQVGLRLEMDEDWHTYWKNPGDSGLPTRIRWTLPEGFEAGELRWPAPHRFLTEPLMSYGYKHEVWLLTEIRPPALVAAPRVTLAARVDWLECREVCLPGKAQLAIALPVTDAPPGRSPQAAAIEGALQKLPRAPRFSSRATASAAQLRLEVEGSAPPQDAYFYPARAGLIEQASAQNLERTDEGFALSMTRAANGTLPDRLEGVLELDGQAFELAIPIARASAPAAATASAPSPGGPGGAVAGLPLALAFALLGGLALNLMPCVLPVLSLKVLGFVRQGGDARGAFSHGVAFSAGVVVFFLALAGGLIALRAAGAQVGWGFQLQSPGFVVFLAMLFLLLALNLLGVFEVGQSLSALGNAAPVGGGLAESFWNGALATLVATPCTAPFMGSALGFALGRPPGVTLLVFAALGLGMSAPYLLLAASPALLRRLPRPGPWMESFKQAMAFPLLGTVAFLVWLFGRQLGVDAVGSLLLALVLIAFGAWAYGRATRSVGSPRALALASAGALVMAGALLGLHQAQAAPDAGPPRPEGWLPFSAERLAELRAAGRPVFVDFTADWCLSCQVNERLALSRDSVRQRFRAERVVLMRADWTRRDEAITRALAEHGRQGVPLYVLYGRDPAAPPRLLPEVLTPGIVLAALDGL